MNYFIIDGFGLAYKAYHAYSSLSSSSGLDSSCVYGFLVLLQSLKKKYPAFHFVIAWDKGHQRRKQVYADYKSNRNSFSIDEHVSDIKEIIASLNISQIEMCGEEADDVIASFVEKNAKNENLIYIYSSDKDLLQLVKNGLVIVIKPKSGKYPEKYFDEEAVFVQYGVNPIDFASFQAFRGDSIDNIPGVPRLPSKVIALLISRYKEPQKVYNYLDIEKLTDFQQKKLINHKEQVYINYELTKLRKDIDYNILNGLSNIEEIKSFLNKYEIKSISADKLTILFEKESSFLDRRAPAIQNYSLF